MPVSRYLRITENTCVILCSAHCDTLHGGGFGQFQFVVLCGDGKHSRSRVNETTNREGRTDGRDSL